MIADGAFSVHWTAHGLSYGIPISVHDDLAAGLDCIANFSRSALRDGAAIFPNFIVLNLTVSKDTLMDRLRRRARESDADISKRLSQAEKPLPAGLRVINVANDGALGETVSAVLAALQPVRT